MPDNGGYLRLAVTCRTFGKYLEDPPFDPWQKLAKLDGRSVAMMLDELVTGDLDGVGARFGVTRERARQVIAKGYAILRHP